MSKIVAVVGATGQQGGAVARALLKSGEWKVRGLTRNTSSKSALALAASGIEVVAANIDDVDSLVKAFEGAYGVYGVTNFWEHLGSGKMDADEAGEAEVKQAQNIATACGKIPTLEHFVFSTLQPAGEISGGKRHVPHMDHKSKVDGWIRKELPDLGAKTTFMWVGFYPANLAFFPLMKPFEMPLSGGKWVWLQASSPTAFMPLAGDVNTNVGVLVAACLANPDKSRHRYVNVTTDVMKMQDILDLWCSITGRQAAFVEATDADFETLWGLAGKEMAAQYRYGQENPDWEILKKGTGELISWADVGVKRSDLVDTKGTFEALHAKGSL